MPTVEAIANALALTIRPEDAAEWDPTGLQLGDPSAEVTVIGVCHEVTEAVVARIEEDPVDLLVTYHPLIFDPVTRLIEGRSPGGRAHRLIVAGVNLFVTHTDFDAAPGGAADALASELGLEDVFAFGPDPAVDTEMIGRAGGYRGSGDDLIDLVVNRLGAGGLRSSLPPDGEVDRVAVVPGSGAGFIPAAAGIADVLVTGDVSHHRSVAALDLGLAIVDPGHIATERPGMRALVGIVRETPGVSVVDLTSIDPATWT